MIHLNATALQEIRRMQSKQEKSSFCFRVGIQSGGCSEFCYTLGLEESAKPDDRTFSCDGIQVVVDPQSWPYLQGLSLDYSEDLMGGGFRFNNPNAVSSCGCGNSFSTTEAEAVSNCDPEL